MRVDGQEVLAVEGHEYGVQISWNGEGDWTMVSTNHFHGWYPSEKSAKNALAQLFGRMVDMPEGVPWFTRDIKQEQERLSDRYFNNGLALPKHKGTAHNALEDARWTREAHEYLILVERDFYGSGGVYDGT